MSVKGPSIYESPIYEVEFLLIIEDTVEIVGELNQGTYHHGKYVPATSSLLPDTRPDASTSQFTVLILQNWWLLLGNLETN